MPRSALRCAYTDCNRTTDDRRAFRRIRVLSPDQLTSFSPWLKSSHDGVVCDYHYTLLRRQLVQEQQQKAAAEEDARSRLESLVAAAVTDSSSSVESTPPVSVSPLLCPDAVTVTVTIAEPTRSASLPTASFPSQPPFFAPGCAIFADPPPHLCFVPAFEDADARTAHADRLSPARCRA